MKNKRKKRFLAIFLPFLLLASFFLFLKISERLIIEKISLASSDSVSVGSISLRFPSVLIRKVSVRNSFVSMFIRELCVRPRFVRNALAFSGPGEIILKEKKRSISIKGSISGNFKNKSVDVKRTSIEIGGIGSLEIKGLLENWGRDSVNASADFKGIEIEEIGEVFDLSLPFSGQVFGKADFMSGKSEGPGNITFDLDIRNIAAEGGRKFNALLKGSYDIQKERAEIFEGKLTGSEGGSIFFSGIMAGEEFKLDFKAENMVLEDFLMLLPLELREKYNLAIKGGTASARDFSAGLVKKNSILKGAFRLACPNSLSWV